MRRLLFLLLVLGMIQIAAGCRHVAGGCDCEHTAGPAAHGDHAHAPAAVVPVPK